MKILHIWDICDNSRYLTEKLIPLGVESKVIDRQRMTVGLFRFLLNVVYQLLFYKADIIHINAWTKGVLLARIFSPRSKILMHFHGSDIRGKKVPSIVILFANLICVSTKDLMGMGLSFPYWPRLLPVLVRDMFYDRGGRIKNTALYRHHYRNFYNKSCRYTSANNLFLYSFGEKMIPQFIIRHSQMPEFLSMFEYYLDFKGYTSKDTLTLTAREAVACGCKVVVDNLDVVESFPQTTIKDYIKVYNEVI